MPYRALTHGRVSDKDPPSSNGVGNNGPPVVQKNKVNPNHQPALFYARTISRNFLIPKNAFGTTNYSSGEGKGFPNATPLGGIGSRNVFARRAIAKKATTSANHKKTCNCTITEPKQLRK